MNPMLKCREGGESSASSAGGQWKELRLKEEGDLGQQECNRVTAPSLSWTGGMIMLEWLPAHEQPEPRRK